MLVKFCKQPTAKALNWLHLYLYIFSIFPTYALNIEVLGVGEETGRFSF
jgi:hypothetical protein